MRKKLQGNPWVERYLPKSISDHFVHKNKVTQFENWLNNKRGSKMCLLTGGTGVGKTATVYVVGESLGFQVKEWVNPMSISQYQSDSADFNPWESEFHGRSITTEFTDFLLRSSQYPSLPVKGQKTFSIKSLILVEDFPNFIYTDTPSFHQLIRNYTRIGECPLVFIMSDPVSSSNGVFKIFPKNLLEECDIQEIGFNAVAPSFMAKFAKYVLSQNNSEVTPKILSEIITASNGDMRSCINSLQFHFQKSTKQSGMGKPSVKKRKIVKTVSSDDVICNSFSPKEESLFLFHAIGKVLYCKRDALTKSEVESKMISEELKRIHPLKEVPEHIGDKIGVNPETFVSFLGQNYLTFFSSMDEILNASRFLSDADLILSASILDDMVGSGTALSFKDRAVREEFGLSIAIRGLMFSNQNPVGTSWKPMQKPKHADVKATADLLIQNVHAYCSNNRSVTQDYYLDSLPLFALIRNQNIPQVNKQFLEKYGRMQHVRTSRDLLDEADRVGEDEIIPESNPILNIKNDNLKTVVDLQEEFVIEDVPD